MAELTRASSFALLLKAPTYLNDLGVIFDSNLTFKDHMAKKNK